jgi:serine/threonine-protein kinase/endoribonuclease IRE1
MSPEGFPLVVFGGNEARDKTTTKRDRERDRKALPAGEGKQEKKDEQIIDPHDSVCMLNPYDLRCIVGVRQVEEGMDEPGGRLKRLLDEPPGPRVKGPAAPISTVPVPVVGVGRTPEHDNDDDRWINENASGNININTPEDVLTISNGHSNFLSQLSHRSKLEAFLFTVLFGIFSAWFLWKRISKDGGKRATAVDHGNQVLEETYLERDHLINDTSITLLDNGTTIHSTMSSPPPPAVITNGHADPINDITNVPIPPSRPLTPGHKHQSTPLISQIPLPSAADDNEDSDAEAEAENGAGAPATPGKRKARRGKRGKKKKPSGLGGEEAVNGSDEKDKAEKEKMTDKDLEGGGEKPSSLILTTSSPKPLAPSTPSLTVSDTILGMFLTFSFPHHIYIYIYINSINFQATVRMAQ